MTVEPIGPDPLTRLLEEATRSELPEPALCAKLAREYLKAGDPASAYSWLARVGDSPGSYTAWAAAAALLAKVEAVAEPCVRRSVRVAVAGSYTTAQLVPLLRLAALRRGVHISVYETGFDSYRQEILDPSSRLYRFDPNYIVLAPHEGAVRFPLLADEPELALGDELAQWTGLWDAIGANSRATIVQHNFVLRPDTAWGHVSGRVAGSRDELLRELNARLARAAGDRVVVVDCDRLAAAYGKTRWFDDRYWFLSKQAVALDALPELARHTAAMVAAVEGLSSKCLVLDLDNTLWGGVIAEEGLAGIELGHGPRGEAFVAFQEYLRALQARGATLAVVSKNNEHDAREPFEAHPDMRLRLNDIAVFVANWQDKAANLRTVAAELNIGLDSLVFVDDNPAERQVVRELVPEVEVIALPADPADYIRAVSGSLLFEVASVTSEDLRRGEHYRARAAAAALEQEASSLEEFYAGLEMEAFIAPFDELNLPRIVQLIGKTNQFNLTTRRHGRTEVCAFMADERCVTLYLRLRDRFSDHGLVALMIAEQRGNELDIDTWLMSCRVIGRTVENKLLAELCELARARGCTTLRGTFIPSEKNLVVRDLFERLGFDRVSAEDDGRTTWTYDITGKGVPANEHIRTAASAIAHG